MKPNKKIIEYFLIILLVFDLIFFFILFVSKKITTKSFLKEATLSFDFKEYLLNDEIIKKGIDNYKYPEDVFNYINNNEVLIIKNKFIDELEIENDSIKKILLNSFYEYEIRTKNNILNNLEYDIELFSNKFVSMINDYVKGYNFLNKISNSIIYSISLISSIILSISLLIIDKNSLIKIIIILFSYSFIIYYFNNNFFMFKYIKNINLKLENAYIICFILSFVLLLIYMFNFFRKFLRNQRIKGYM